MVLCIDTLPPIEGHPIVENAYKMVYVVLIVIAAVAFISPFTGSQINPAVTFGLYLPVWRTHYKTILTYWAAQYSGAIVGVILNRNIIGNGGPIFKEAPDFLSLTKMGVE
jgi:glycerol uptake facilitator-like aquaporin